MRLSNHNPLYPISFMQSPAAAPPRKPIIAKATCLSKLWTLVSLV